MSYEPSTSGLYKGRSSSLRRRSQDPSYLSIPNAIATLPSVHRLSVERLQYGTESGCLDFKKRVKEIAIKAWEEEEKLKRSTNLTNIQPNEFLNCRYLRLSKNNIATLLQQCKDSGSQIDIHPHMKDTDIDINALIFPEKQNTVSFTDTSRP
ncbi:uncharacterized protein C16orf78 homolog [Spea bombifrons]|uniref:uncharacterized protein C16orf78 homolog n=1 Tax=Spea bombifrons TaxID=233779 RepID=UPI00234A25D6|nr:uncharacterized protein C16orf78 homolog [Spea bombifrons]